VDDWSCEDTSPENVSGAHGHVLNISTEPAPAGIGVAGSHEPARGRTISDRFLAYVRIGARQSDSRTAPAREHPDQGPDRFTPAGGEPIMTILHETVTKIRPDAIDAAIGSLVVVRNQLRMRAAAA